MLIGGIIIIYFLAEISVGGIRGIVKNAVGAYTVFTYIKGKMLIKRVTFIYVKTV